MAISSKTEFEYGPFIYPKVPARSTHFTRAGRLREIIAGPARRPSCIMLPIPSHGDVSDPIHATRPPAKRSLPGVPHPLPAAAPAAGIPAAGAEPAAVAAVPGAGLRRSGTAAPADGTATGAGTRPSRRPRHSA